MTNESDQEKPEKESVAGEGVTPAGIVEAVTQDVELIVDKLMDTAEGAVVAVQQTLGIAKPARPRAKKPAKPTAKPRAVKAKARATKAKPRKAIKPRKVTQAAKPKRAAKSRKARATR